jgi:hypothetical protein
MVNKIRKPWIAGLLTFLSIGQGILFIILGLLLIASPLVILILFIGCAVGYFIFGYLMQLKLHNRTKQNIN